MPYRNKEKRKLYFQKWVKKHPEYHQIHNKMLKYKFQQYKRTAKDRGFIFNLTLNEFSDIMNKPCYYCGENGYGLDRIDNSIGYLKNNVVSCCTMCNFMKSNHTEEEFINQCIKIVNNIQY